MTAGQALRLFTFVCAAWLTVDATGIDRAHAQDADSGPAYAEDLARQRFQLGRLHYDNGEFQQAAENFEEAYRLSKRDVLWYNIHLAHRDAGNGPKAAEALRNYLGRVEAITNRAQLEARLIALDKQVEEAEGRRSAEEKAAAERQAQEAEAARRNATQTVQTDEPSKVRKYLPYGLMGGGGLLIVGGVLTGVMASSTRTELEEKCPDNRCPEGVDADGLKSSGATLATTSLALYGVGIATAAAGGVLWFLDWRKSRVSAEAPVTAAFGCGREGCGGNVRWKF